MTGELKQDWTSSDHSWTTDGKRKTCLCSAVLSVPWCIIISPNTMSRLTVRLWSAVPSIQSCSHQTPCLFSDG